MAKEFTETGELGPIYRQFEKKPREEKSQKVG